MFLILSAKLCFFAFSAFTGTKALTIRQTPVHELSIIQNLEFSPSISLNNIPEKFNVTFSLEGESRNIRLGLSRNEGIFSHAIFVNHLGSDGKIRKVETIPEKSHLVFLGTVFLAQDNGDFQQRAGWARITVHYKNGVHLLEGAFSIDGITYNVQTDDIYRRTKSAGDLDVPVSQNPYSIAWRDTQGRGRDYRQKRQVNNSAQCSFDNLDFNRGQLASIQRKSNLAELETRQNGDAGSLDLIDVIGSTEGCPNSRMVALLGIATDCTYTAQFDSTDDLREHVLAQINTASQLYEQSFNISLRVRNLTISDAACPTQQTAEAPWNGDCSSGLSTSDRLGVFSQWRSEIDDSENAVWTLLTGCNSGSTVGIAWMGTLCRDGSSSWGSSSSTSSTNVVVRTPSEWQVIAHEIGHNFGAVHDCTAGCSASSESQPCCPYSEDTCDAGGNYIMNPASNQGMTEFSPCSIGNICASLGRNLLEKSAIVVEKTAVKTMTAANRYPVACNKEPSAIRVLIAAAQGSASFQGVASSVERVLDLVIRKRFAMAPQHHAQTMCELRMVRPVGAKKTVWLAPLANAHLEICSARLSSVLTAAPSHVIMTLVL
ncbi:hypothetical protein G7Z17_g1476 [Cylindrodendrum hubeiense]|uniref:Peptidase M12B domain-containing protein n=1 Tax=Cylindrodendrum hubeiense TaxID=595255 RepID=A0A9P5LFC5_9HYPO|nr:hypothetical protein G7Z17_g1476 [Cylindrodendrum hubeiense]